ncbi:MAG: hypothetical protein PHN72_03650 [Bacilli bacterium]|nr:hypothetical protein [Bacilli bacterium]
MSEYTEIIRKLEDELYFLRQQNRDAYQKYTKSCVAERQVDEKIKKLEFELDLIQEEKELQTTKALIQYNRKNRMDLQEQSRELGQQYDAIYKKNEPLIKTRMENLERAKKWKAAALFEIEEKLLEAVQEEDVHLKRLKEQLRIEESKGYELIKNKDQS